MSGENVWGKMSGEVVGSGVARVTGARGQT